jgi:hypothetical protein
LNAAGEIVENIVPPVRKHKALGIASFVLALALLFVFVALVALEI